MCLLAVSEAKSDYFHFAVLVSFVILLHSFSFATVRVADAESCLSLKKGSVVVGVIDTVISAARRSFFSLVSLITSLL